MYNKILKIIKYIINLLKILKDQGTKVVVLKLIQTIENILIPEPQKTFKDVLFINGCGLEHPSRYRVDHQIEQLHFYNISCDKIWYEDINIDHIKQYHCFIIFRCPLTPDLEKFIKKAKSYNKHVIYDIDDLVFDEQYVRDIKYLKSINESELKIYYDGVKRMGDTLDLCDYAITTTEGMANELKLHVKDVLINRNVASEEMLQLSNDATLNIKNHNEIIIGYSSGSITHNDDYFMIEESLIKILGEFNNVKLSILGLLDIPTNLQKYKEQIIAIPFSDWRELPAKLATFDINIAPLEDTLFNRAKSENKWLEAALVKVPTVASNIGAFKKIISNNSNGILVNNDTNSWYKALKLLILDKGLRAKIGENAYNEVIQNKITSKSGKNIADFILNLQKNTVAFVIPGTRVSGGINVISKHAEILQRNGYAITFISRDIDNTNITVNMTDINVNSIYSYNFSSYFNTMTASLWSTKNFVETYPKVTNKYYLVQNYETNFYSNKDQISRMFANSTYNDLSNIKFITISKWCKDWLKDDFNKDSIYIPNGIDSKRFVFKKRDFKKSKLIVLVEGNSNDFYKNVDESFRIVNSLDKNKYTIWYLSYGGGPKQWYYYDKFFQEIPYDEVHKIYQQAHILLKSSKLESFSYPPLEMMSTGGIAVVARNPGNAEYCIHEVNCLLYDVGDISSALKHFNTIANDEILRNKIILNGKSIAQSRDWQKIEEEIINLYK
jgi:O-antigen biosynthesis protein